MVINNRGDTDYDFLRSPLFFSSIDLSANSTFSEKTKPLNINLLEWTERDLNPRLPPFPAGLAKAAFMPG
jgi:hypothetical protein